MVDPRNSSDPEQLTKWLGLFISIFAILAWFGVDNWHELDAWLHRNDASRAAPSAHVKPAPSSTAVPSPRPTSTATAEPGCVEAVSVLRASLASMQGSTPAPEAAANEYRGFARNFDHAADDSVDPHVEAALRAMAIDQRTLADDVEALDFGAADAMGNQFHTDASTLSTACRNAGRG
ncbi:MULTISPECIES: hypothetical protein [Streptomyces]|uniref:hypothetical protein n=1 Tax=Streptomyces TaxID=1883 RepID=UPI001161367B|nr:hypothetical protein [Streptomyces sp. F-1]